MRPFVSLVVALYCAAAAAQLYSWKDADGKVHYSDEPPPTKAPVRKLNAAAPAPVAPPAAAPAPKSGGAEPDADKKAKDPKAKDPKAEKAAKAENPAEAEQRRANCEKARGNVQALESGSVRFTVNAQGERVALEGGVLQSELASARQAAESWCK